MNKKNKKINDIDLRNWKDNKDIILESLWILPERDKSYGHSGFYHGNFIPQIPRQLIIRYSKKNDVVLDPFLGSGTTLIECQRLQRNGIGIEISPDIAEIAKKQLNKLLFKEYKNEFNEIIVGDSSLPEAKEKVLNTLKKYNRKKVQLIIMHPPYYDIIKFTNLEGDLSRAKSLDEYLRKFGDVVENFIDLLEKNHFMTIVIGDKYSKGEWIPLGFLVLDETLKRSNKIRLKSIVIKNIENNRGKFNQENLWRYRALVGGFYIFKHEYILLFEKFK
jgi:DNA modification methylase